MKSFRKNAKWHILIVLFFANIFIWHAVFAGVGGDVLTVAFLDVGQGDAIFIEAPSGHQMLVDGGPNKKVLAELSKVMPFYDRSLDVVLATHPDHDHIGGLSAVLSRFDVDIFMESGNRADTGAYNALTLAVEESGVEEIIARRHMRIDLGGGAYGHILFPDRDVSAVESNTASIIVMITYGETAFLLTGDAPRSVERYLASLYGASLGADVLKAGHHGSRTSTDELFLGYAAPSYAVISAGKDNRYGHPHTEVLELLERFGAEIIQTSESGTVIFKSDGKRVERHP